MAKYILFMGKNLPEKNTSKFDGENCSVHNDMDGPLVTAYLKTTYN